MRSLRNRLALVFFAITFLAIGGLYLYVGPGLEQRLLDEKLKALATAAERDSRPISETVGSSSPQPEVRRRVDNAGLSSGDRVTLLIVGHATSGLSLSVQADSRNRAATEQ